MLANDPGALAEVGRYPPTDSDLAGDDILLS
jgi:hypothetical protein